MITTATIPPTKPQSLELRIGDTVIGIVSQDRELTTVVLTGPGDGSISFYSVAGSGHTQDYALRLAAAELVNLRDKINDRLALLAKELGQ